MIELAGYIESARTKLIRELGESVQVSCQPHLPAWWCARRTCGYEVRLATCVCISSVCTYRVHVRDTCEGLSYEPVTEERGRDLP